ncbi:MAG: DinB family protein [Gemmatimonadales bacterium]
MTAPPPPEAWLRGPLPDIVPPLQPVAHALVQAGEDLARVVPTLTTAELWVEPGGAAPAGYHVKHATGSLDRLVTYARGEALSAGQRATLAAEGLGGDSADALLTRAQVAIDAALGHLRTVPAAALAEPRLVGRAQLPATVLGLLFHAAEHTTRHVGQLITTVKVVRGLRLA